MGVFMRLDIITVRHMKSYDGVGSTYYCQITGFLRIISPDNRKIHKICKKLSNASGPNDEQKWSRIKNGKLTFNIATTLKDEVKEFENFCIMNGFRPTSRKKIGKYCEVVQFARNWEEMEGSNTA